MSARLTQAQRDEIRALYTSPEQPSLRAIAIQLGVAHHSVRRALHYPRAGEPAFEPRVAPEKTVAPILHCACGKVLGPHNKSGSCRVCTRLAKNPKRILPADFAVHAPHETYRELQDRYGVGVTTVERWRRETGIPAPISTNKGRAHPSRKPLPDGFELVAPTLTFKQLRERYCVGTTALQRWIDETGVQQRKAGAFQRPFQGLDAAGKARATLIINRRDMSRAGEAAYFLQKWDAIWRCTEAGVFDTRGTHWRYLGSVRSDAWIIERAVAKNWDPDAWKQLADAA